MNYLLKIVIYYMNSLHLLEKQTAWHLPVFSILFFSKTFPEYQGTGKQKNILQTIEQLKQFSYLLL